MNLRLVMARMLLVKLCACLAVALLAGCSLKPKQTAEQRYASAKALFEKASREYHIPSAQARGAERCQLEQQAATLYAEIVGQYGDQPVWASQALRSLANIRASQTNITEAVKLYAQLGNRFPAQDFEVLMAWKSAGDLLSDAGRQVEAKTFYQRIVARFDKPDALPVVESVVRGCKSRLNGGLLFSRNAE